MCSMIMRNKFWGEKNFSCTSRLFWMPDSKLPKELFEAYAAEITRLVLEAFPNYGEPAIAMEWFRRFVVGLDPVLQTKCHEDGAVHWKKLWKFNVNGSVHRKSQSLLTHMQLQVTLILLPLETSHTQPWTPWLCMAHQTWKLSLGLTCCTDWCC